MAGMEAQKAESKATSTNICINGSLAAKVKADCQKNYIYIMITAT